MVQWWRDTVLSRESPFHITALRLSRLIAALFYYRHDIWNRSKETGRNVHRSISDHIAWKLGKNISLICMIYDMPQKTSLVTEHHGPFRNELHACSEDLIPKSHVVFNFVSHKYDPEVSDFVCIKEWTKIHYIYMFECIVLDTINKKDTSEKNSNLRD